jgi:methanogenic corrinoid protein MtbC1
MCTTGQGYIRRVAEPARGPELSELETFVLAIEEGSIARAAARLRISSPAAAKRIRQLETLAHAPLLVRGRRGVTATELGQLLYPIARDLVLRRADAVDALRGTAPATRPRAEEKAVGRHRPPTSSPGTGTTKGTLDERFLEALRQGRSDIAIDIVDAAFAADGDIAAVHSQVIGPAMKRIGDLWERNIISVDEEHLATEISHKVIARLFWRSMNGPSHSGKRVVMAAVQGEQHVLGLRMAADVLEIAGYEVVYLGANLPLTALLHACRMHGPHVLGLTVSMPLNIPTLIWEVGEVRKLAAPPLIMVGGRVAKTAVHNGLRASYVQRSDQVLEVVDRLLAVGEAVPAAS